MCYQSSIPRWLALFSLLWSTALTAAEPADRWQAAMDAFAAHDRTTPPPENAILFIGSSSIRMWDVRKSFDEAATINRGFGGSQYADIVRHADRLIRPYQARAIVLYSGDNDLWHGKTPEEVHRDFLSVVKAIRDHQANVPIVVIGVKPSIARRKIDGQIRHANRLMAESAAKVAHMAFVDPYQFMLDGDGEANQTLFVGDGLHLNAAGYALWTPRVRKAIEDLEASGADEQN